MVAQERKIIALKAQLAEYRKKLRTAEIIISSNCFSLDGKASISQKGQLDVNTPVATDLNLVKVGNHIYQFNSVLTQFVRVRV